TREQIFQALKAAGTDSAPLCLLRLGLIDEKEFTEVWARHSGLGVRFVNPYDIPEGLLRQFPETQALQVEAIPVERQNGQLIMAFREPPGLELLAQLNQQLNATVVPHLARPGSELEGRELDRQAYDKIGPAFWWLHRMLPLRDAKIVPATVPHPAALRWLAGQLGREPVLVAELPDALELAMKKLDLDLDPDQVLLDSLVAKGWLKQGAVSDLRALRSLIADPIPKWLVLQKLVGGDQLHQTFLET